MPDLGRFEVRQVDLAYAANLERPSFDLFARWVEFQDALYSRFSRFELRLADIKLESTSNNPADLSVACWILRYAAVIRYRLDRVEVWSNTARLANDTELAVDVIANAVGVVRTVSRAAQVALHTMTVDMNGILNRDTLDARIAAYLTATPPGLPALVTGGVSFLCQFPSGDGRGSIVLERSAGTPTGAHLRIVSEHHGSLPEREVVARAIEFVRTSVKRLELEIVWSQ